MWVWGPAFRKRDFWLVAHRGETAERVKYHFKEEVKARACESIRRRTIYAQARAQFDTGIMKNVGHCG